MTVSHSFLFVGGDPVLDFVNTEIVRDGERVDLLDSTEALGQWLREAGLGKGKVTPAALRGAKRLRAALRRMFSGEGSAVRAVNEALRRGPGSLELRTRDGRLALEFEPRTLDARFLLARAAATFLAGADPARIRPCEGTNCILFFYDTTKSGTRRWCSMAACGNRMKAALHYKRRSSER